MVLSASRQIFCMMVTHSNGYLPLAVSPESMTQSVPSWIALATSVTSARVGRGLEIIDSSICVAVMTGLPALLHLEIIIFCATNTFSIGISTPRSPRATMMPSASLRISSKLSSPCWFSIFAKIFTPRPSRPINDRISAISSGLRINDAAMQSIPCVIPKMISSSSLGVIDGSSTILPGRLTPLFHPSMPSFSTRHLTASVEVLTDKTVNRIRPSSTKILSPSPTVKHNLS
mmetsp:Transcript_27782/g.64055  ORF Transcript_27782/g.64055 Transcript_27782/m.64055 type:complete len:231 (-) Transcript_27782:402-1094(-)